MVLSKGEAFNQSMASMADQLSTPISYGREEHRDVVARLSTLRMRTLESELAMQRARGAAQMHRLEVLFEPEAM